jgi:hypothetical protein
MVEVMVGLAVLAIGASGVIALQKTALGGNLYARNLVTANQIAQNWLERLKVDALAWNSNNAADMAETTWIQQAPFPADWFRPIEAVGEGSPAADVAGRDIYAASTGAAFCTHIRLTPLLPGPIGPAVADAELVRAEVRVFFSRTNQTIDDECANDTFSDFSDPLAHNEYGFVYHTGAIRRNTITP